MDEEEDEDEDEFKRRFRNQFQDPAFEPLKAELEKVTAAAWEAYEHSGKSPRTQKAGPEFADPSYELATDWLAARGAICEAQRRHDDANGPRRFLLMILDPSLLFLTSRARSFTLIFSSVRHPSPEQFGAQEIDWRTERFQEIRHANRRDCCCLNDLSNLL